jgi:DNA-binding transcriptional LysR family regulator
MDRLANITAFVRVAENGGFSAAARRLNLSTTTVSDEVQALENTLGARLLNRTTRRVSLTEIGRKYYERCSLILHELAEADEAAASLQLTPRGHLRIYSQQGVSQPVGEAVTLFLNRHPGVTIDLRTGDVMPDLVQDGFDLMVTPAAPPDSIRFDSDAAASGGLPVYCMRGAVLLRQAFSSAKPGGPRQPQLPPLRLFGVRPRLALF